MHFPFFFLLPSTSFLHFISPLNSKISLLTQNIQRYCEKKPLSNMIKLAIQIPDTKDGKKLVGYVSSKFENSRRIRRGERES